MTIRATLQTAGEGMGRDSKFALYAGGLRYRFGRESRVSSRSFLDKKILGLQLKGE